MKRRPVSPPSPFDSNTRDVGVGSKDHQADVRAAHGPERTGIPPSPDVARTLLAAAAEAGLKKDCFERVGRGGQGEVYFARDADGQEIAVKIVDLLDSRATERFGREVAALSMLTNDHVVRLRKHGLAHPHGWIVMEYVHGWNLRQVLDGRAKVHGTTGIPWQLAVRIIAQVCDGLHAAHQEGVIHRDVKPANIVLASRTSQSPRVVLVDFGAAWIERDSQESRAHSAIGTHIYRPPERTDGTCVQKGDVYSIGVVLFEALTGSSKKWKLDYAVTHALQERSVDVLSSAVIEEPHARGELRRLIARTSRIDPEKRPSAKQLRDELVALVGNDELPASIFEELGIPPVPVGRAAPGTQPTLSTVASRTTEGMTESEADPRHSQTGPSPSWRDKNGDRSEPGLRRPQRKPAVAAGIGAVAMLAGLGGAAAWWLWREPEPRAARVATREIALATRLTPKWLRVSAEVWSGERHEDVFWHQLVYLTPGEVELPERACAAQRHNMCVSQCGEKSETRHTYRLDLCTIDQVDAVRRSWTAGTAERELAEGTTWAYAPTGPPVRQYAAGGGLDTAGNGPERVLCCSPVPRVYAGSSSAKAGRAMLSDAAQVMSQWTGSFVRDDHLDENFACASSGKGECKHALDVYDAKRLLTRKAYDEVVDRVRSQVARFRLLSCTGQFSYEREGAFSCETLVFPRDGGAATLETLRFVYDDEGNYCRFGALQEGRMSCGANAAR